MKYLLLLGLCTTLLVTTAVQASNNIDLSTVPERKTVQLTIYNSEDLTLVRETRQIVFKKGNNALQFSWANTLIDPTSVNIRFLDHPDKLSLVETTYPHAKPQMLYWNIASELDGPVTVEISYFTSGISWAADYTGIASADESKMKIEGFVKVTNRSGEDYEDAQVRLVVGKVNLVEGIAQLAQQGVGQEGALNETFEIKKRRVLHKAVERAEQSGGALFSDATDSKMDKLEEAKDVQKQGLSEYFIFVIEGTETIPNGWSKRMRSFQTDKAEVKVQYRYRPREYGGTLVKMYLMTNDKDAGMGDAPLPDGVFRIFQDSGDDGLKYLTQQAVQYIPAGDKIELNLGHDPNVIFHLVARAAYRDDFLMRFDGVDILFEPHGQRRIDTRSNAVGWQDNTIYEQVIRNTRDKAIEVEVRQPFGGDATFVSAFDAKSFDATTVEYTTTLEAGEQKEMRYRLTQRQGRHFKQNRVLVEQGQVPAVNFVE